jgi:cytochrome c
LHTGKTSDGSEVQGAMSNLIKQRYSKLTDEDALAIAQYLKSIPSVVNEIQ